MGPATLPSRFQARQTLGLAAACYALFWAVVLEGWWRRGSLLAACPMPVILAAFNLSHDGSHGAVSRAWPLANILAAYTALPFYYSPVAWAHQHVYSRHSHTNELQDCDASHGHTLGSSRLDPKRESWRPGFRWGWALQVGL